MEFLPMIYVMKGEIELFKLTGNSEKSIHFKDLQVK